MSKHMLHTLRFFVEVEVYSMVARRDLEEQYRQRLKEFLWTADPRITQREVVYLHIADQAMGRSSTATGSSRTARRRNGCAPD